MIPVVDLPREAFFDGFHRLLNPRLRPRPDFLKMLTGNVLNRIRDCALLDARRQPTGRKGWFEKLSVLGTDRTVVEVRRVASRPRAAVLSEFNEFKAPGDETSAAILVWHCMLDGVLQEAEHSNLIAGVLAINQHGASPKEVAILLQEDVGRRV